MRESVRVCVRARVCVCRGEAERARGEVGVAAGETRFPAFPSSRRTS